MAKESNFMIYEDGEIRSCTLSRWSKIKHRRIVASFSHGDLELCFIGMDSCMFEIRWINNESESVVVISGPDNLKQAVQEFFDQVYDIAEEHRQDPVFSHITS